MDRRTDGETWGGRNGQGGWGMKEFIGRVSSAVSMRGRSDYVLMVMRVRQREMERGREEEGDGE